MNDDAMTRALTALAECDKQGIQPLDEQSWMNPEDKVAVCEPFARAIREAVAAERERCAKVAEDRAEFNRSCPAGCKCADGWHVATAIREGK